ncbi:MAG: TIGR02921 family PEP-CTERM protein [Chloroflexota bacterium]|nr:TIGR02921 family PEP-CTERM protein [Chloroflexota bacterium]
MKKQTFIRKLANRRGWAYGLFWSWNIIFLAFLFLGFAPQVLPEMMTAVDTGVIPAPFLVYAVILTIIPAVAVILGLTLLRRSPGRLLALGYGVEGPLMLVLVVRFFLVRDATLAITLLLSIAGLGIAALLWQILDRNIDARQAPLAYLRMIGLTLLLLTGLYVSVWIAFYAIPLVAQGWHIVTQFLRDMWGSFRITEWRWIPISVLGPILALYTGTLLVVMPIAVPILYVRAWWSGVRAFVAGQGRVRAAALVTIVLLACAALLVPANQQPQQRAFALLEDLPSNPVEAQELLDRQEQIRAGLLNAYLAPFRYISAVGEVYHVSDMYTWAFDMTQKQSYRIQQLYEIVARPLLYAPVEPPEPDGDSRWDNRAFREEPVKAARLYKEFFDRPIVTGERDTIVRAVRSTWSFDQAEAAWQAVDDREILLTHQEVTVVENGDWAEVELYEVYQNQTAQRQEVVYYFSLPESAVVTGLWLGNSPDREERFSYRVAPRGAAQAVYRNEVRRNLDPALIEQIGPRQYRLRVFPVEPQRWLVDDAGRSTIEDGPSLYMWLTYRVLASANAWPLPRLAEKRNVYWDGGSVRLVNGEPMVVGEETARPSSPQAWLPESVKAASPVKPVGHRVEFPSGETVVVHPASAGDLTRFAGDLQLAVILDRSRSMIECADDVKAALARLSVLAAPETDVYLTASEYRGEEPSLVNLGELDPDTLMYYGGQNAAELLVQFDALRAGREYDALLVLTDGSGYELSTGDVHVPIPDAPVWMVHLGGDFPLGYDDATLEAIQASGGGATGSVEETLTRLTVAIEDRNGLPAHDVVDGYTWLTVPAGDAGVEPDATVPDDGFAAFAARRLILAEMERQRGALDQLETLDHLHDIAIKHSIVTPYSSMIVLVEQQQERLLDELEKRDDRFQREYEEIGETVPESVLNVTGVPEPEEWLLLSLAAAMLLWYTYTAQRGPRRASMQ